MTFKDKNNKGFTLVEILISASLFAMVVAIATNIFLFTGRLQRLMANSINVSDNISLTLEIISRDARMAQLRPGQPMFSSSPQSSIAFMDYRGQNVIYRLNNGRIEKSENGGVFLPLTPSNVNVENLRFIIDGNELNDGRQPLVKIFMKISWSVGVDTVENYLQTVITPRNLDIEI